MIEGIKAGARLPAIKVLAGYARTGRSLAARFVDRARWAQAKAGVPIGNGRNFGLVVSPIHDGPSGPGGDTSRTGVPNALSIDTNGDGTIDALAPGTVSQSPIAHIAQVVQPLQFFSTLYLFPDSKVNADAASVGTAQIDAGLKKQLHVLAANVPAGNEVSLDCGGLSYCAAGGTGKLRNKDGDSYYLLRHRPPRFRQPPRTRRARARRLRARRAQHPGACCSPARPRLRSAPGTRT